MAKNWIAGAIKHPGALHKQLGVPAGQPIPAKKKASARAGNYGALAAKRANLAKTLGSFHQGGTVPETGTYKLEKGEKVTPSQEYDKQERPGSPCCLCGDSHDGECRIMASPDEVVRRKGNKRFDF